MTFPISQLTSRVEYSPSLSSGPRSFLMLSFMFSFLCCLKAFSSSHSAMLNRRSGHELQQKTERSMSHSSQEPCYTIVNLRGSPKLLAASLKQVPGSNLKTVEQNDSYLKTVLFFCALWQAKI